MEMDGKKFNIKNIIAGSTTIRRAIFRNDNPFGRRFT